MLVGMNEVCKRHNPGRVHPDQPGRLTVIERALAECDHTAWSEPNPARRDDIERVHDVRYLDELHAFCTGGGGPWDPDTVASEETWSASLASAGLAIWAARRATKTPPGAETPFALCRPPGHHARADDAMGFCFFNNVAIAAASLLDEGMVERIGIIDWDAHHANGTQQYVQRQPSTALVSLHQRGLYPGTGRLESTDVERILNVPLPSDLGDAEYLHAFEQTVAPAMRAYGPDVLLVSCGFDIHRKDLLASQEVTCDGFGLLADGVKRLARELDVGVGFVLEGGYAMDVLGECATAIADAFAGHVPERPAYHADRRLEEVLEQTGAHPLISLD